MRIPEMHITLDIDEERWIATRTITDGKGNTIYKTSCPIESEAFANDPVCQLEEYLTEYPVPKTNNSSLSDEEIRLRTLELVQEKLDFSREHIIAYSIGIINYVKNGFYPKFNGREDFGKQVTEEMLLRLHKQVADELVDRQNNADNLGSEQPNQCNTPDTDSDNCTNSRKSFISFFRNLFRRL